MRICFVTKGTLNEFSDGYEGERADILCFGFQALGKVSYERELKGETSLFEDVALLSQYSDLTTHTRLCVLDLIKVFHELTATAPKPFQKGSKSRHSPRRRGQPVLAGQRDTDRRPR